MAQTLTLHGSGTGDRSTSPTLRHNHATAVPGIVRARGSEDGSFEGIQIRDFAPSDLVPAAQLLALGYQRARHAAPQLPADLRSARPWAVRLGRRVSTGGGVVATSGGALVGFIVSAPTDPAGSTQQGEAGLPEESFAVASHVDATLVCSQLQLALAQRLANSGTSAEGRSY